MRARPHEVDTGAVLRRASSAADDKGPLLLLILPAWAGVGLHRVFGHKMPPMALLVLAAAARQCGWRVKVVDLNEEALPTERPDVVGITVWTMLAPQAYAVADAYRAQGVPVVLGGVHPSLMPTEALRHADAVVVGEAESLLPAVLEDLRTGQSQGLYRGDWLTMNSVPPAKQWLDLVAAMPLTRYIPLNTLQTTRGCRFNCDFCSVIRINGRGSRHRVAADAAAEMAEVVRHGQRLGSFAYTFLLDDDLAADREYTGQLCEAILSAGVKTTWGAQASIGFANDPELVDLAARSGCRVVFTGFESASRETLIECNKKNRPSQFQEAVARLHRHGIMVEGGFIFGFDHDTPNVFAETVAFVEAIEVDAAHFSILTPYPGTQTFANLVGEGRILHYDWGRYDLYHVAIQPQQMSVEELQEGLWWAYRAFYGRGPRARRLWRHVRTRMPAVFTAALAANNWAYSRHYGSPVLSSAEPFEADPADLAQLLTTSAAPAQEALSEAFRQAVALAPTRRPRPVDVPN